MDIFRSLSMGGAKFDKNRFKDDLNLFNASSSSSSSSFKPGSKLGNGARDDAQKSSAPATTLIMPETLDFFGSASKAARNNDADNVAVTASAVRQGKAKAEQSGEDSDEEEQEGPDGSSSKKGKKRKREEEPLTKATLPSFLKAHKLKLTGTDVPMPLASWEELETRFKVGSWLFKNLQKWGWEEPTAIQRGAMSVMLENRDLLAGAPTGSGKTLAFLLPLIHHLKNPAKDGFRAVIVSPTRELAQQIYEQLRRLSEGRRFRICVLTKATESTLKQDPALRKKYDILITTPLRLVHAIEQEELELDNVRHLVLDEADRLLEQGFLEQTDAILAACSHPELRKALFSATLPAGVEEMAKTFMVDECRVIVGTKDGATETIKQSLQFVGSEDGKLHAMRSLIQSGGLKPPVLLFVQSIQRAKELFHELVYDGLHVDVIHSERPKAQREGVISAFKRGDIWVLICTELMARGIDFKGVRLVINYDFPQSVQSYVHRIGRTGRAGRQGEAITYFTKEDAPYLKTIVNVMRQSGCEVPQWLVELPNPSKKIKRKLKAKAPERTDVRVAAGSSIVGRREARKRKEMVEASKRRKNLEKAPSRSE
ncbi:putative ROK1-ATP-dependent RNA helicase [Violaceomyces palustris]|uniref:ROK1-ATP-dependent RNA helicase n=1 Tax=Violaceomyces palustris TaxID=1673888 RepID=A0ACD0NWY6_9BASI|nr:putative ROK1-ATP-dependent RNA helicase [Violaceomyces palustris]